MKWFKYLQPILDFLSFLIFQQYFFAKCCLPQSWEAVKCQVNVPRSWNSQEFVVLVWIIDSKITVHDPPPLQFLQWFEVSPTPAKKLLDVFQSDLKTRIIWVFQQTFEEIRFLNRCVRAKKNQARLPAPIALIGDFPDLPRKSFRWYLDVYFENYAEMDSTHQELYFLLLWASQLSKRSSGGLGEVKKM